MSPANDQSRAATPDGGDAYVRQQLASIDGSLFSGMPVDDRFESGVPEGQRGSSLDFIQMTGLTRPPLRQSGLGVDGALAQTPIYDDLNASEPLSFYEKGVADVDDSVGRGLLDGGLRDIMLDVDLLPGRPFEAPVAPAGASPSVQAFRDIVANLQRTDAPPESGTPQAPTDGEEPSPPAPEESEPEREASSEDLPVEYSTSGALLALMEELESAVAHPPESDSEASEAERSKTPEAEGQKEPVADDATEEVKPAELPESPVLSSLEDPEETLVYVPPAPDLPAPVSAHESADSPTQSDDTGDVDFDALLASLEAPADAQESTPEFATSEVELEPEPAAAESLTESWDDLLDSMSVRGAEPESPRVVAPRAPVSGALAEAEQLMQALEKRPRSATDSGTLGPAPAGLLQSAEESTPAPVPPISIPVGHVVAPVGLLDGASTPTPEAPPKFDYAAPPVTIPAVVPADLQEDSGPPAAEAPLNFDYAAPPNQRRSRRHSRIARRSRKIIKLVIMLALAGGAGTAFWYYGIGPMLMKPEDVSVQAQRHMAAKKYEDASRAYSALAQRYGGGDPLRADAEFNAAYALTLGPEVNWDATRPRYERALVLFKSFVDAYPQHPKRARALSIMGRLHYELREFDQAIMILRDQVKTLDDPPSALARLRYLARAYSMKGSYGEAESTYLQSATLPGNYSAESDYLELGDLYGRRAEAEENPDERARLKKTATEYWNRALQVPGIAPTVRSTLEEKLKWLDFAEQSTTDAPGAGSAPIEAPVSLDVPADGAAAPDSANEAALEHVIPVATDPAGRAEIPGAELEALAPPAPPEVAAPEVAPVEEAAPTEP